MHSMQNILMPCQTVLQNLQYLCPRPSILNLCTSLAMFQTKNSIHNLQRARLCFPKVCSGSWIFKPKPNICLWFLWFISGYSTILFQMWVNLLFEQFEHSECFDCLFGWTKAPFNCISFADATGKQIYWVFEHFFGNAQNLFLCPGARGFVFIYTCKICQICFILVIHI